MKRELYTHVYRSLHVNPKLKLKLQKGEGGGGSFVIVKAQTEKNRKAQTQTAKPGGWGLLSLSWNKVFFSISMTKDPPPSSFAVCVWDFQFFQFGLWQ